MSRFISICRLGKSACAQSILNSRSNEEEKKKPNICGTIAPSFIIMVELLHHNVVHLLQLDYYLFVRVCVCAHVCVYVSGCRWRLVSFQLTEL